EIIANLEDMTNRLLAVNPNMRIVLVTMPPVTGYNGKGANGQRLTFEPGSNEKIKTLNEWIKTKAQNSKHVGCVDLYNMVEDPARPGYINPKYNGDGLHLNSAGYRILREAVSGELLAVER
ncbi:MAG: GDSL-type esterase/lipase family protein, partial [Candidatus Paceibacterota bacterium]